jgi:orotidine 5'-phosphate decarboxylase subfamily 2
MTFQQKLDAIVKKNNSLLCVALDADFEKISKAYKNKDFPQFAFNKWLIDETAPFVSAYKPNTAFYEARGSAGIRELQMSCDYIKEHYSDHLLILDAKRADIGNTNMGYVTFAYDFMKADAITLHPYLGSEALAPFLSRKDKGAIILCRTSNPGAGEFQDRIIDGKPLYMQVANSVVKKWNLNHNCMLVVGATYPTEMKELRAIDDDFFFLVPGIGAQGGDLEKTLEAGLNSKKTGMLITIGRSIIFAEKPGEEAKKIQDEINKFRNY